MIIPPAVPQAAGGVRLHAFRILARTSLGRLAWFDFQGKAPPPEQALAAICGRLDLMAFESERAIQNELARIEYDCHIKFVDGDCLEADAWPVDGWIQLQMLAMTSQMSHVAELVKRRQAIIDQSRDFLHWSLLTFREAMDPAQAMIWGRAGGARIHAWNYMHHSDSRLRRNRTQALCSYPFLVDYICLDEFGHIRHAIDAEASLEKALSQHFGVKAALVRRIGHQSIRDLRGPFANPGVLMSFMDTIPLSAVPCTAEEWSSFMLLADRVAEFIDQPVNTPLGLAILAECLSRKDAMKLALSDDWHQYQNALRHLLHALVSIAGFLYQGRFSPREANLKARALVGKFVSRLGLRPLFRFSSLWSAAYRDAVAMDAERRDAMRRYRWPTLVPGPVALGEFTATPLQDIASLSLEGARMSNCVASYAADCRSGICQIWSLQSQDKTMSATLQTFVDAVHANTRPIIRFGQIEGPKGSDADPALVVAARQLIAELSKAPEKLWDYMVEVDRHGANATSGQIDGFAAQSLVRALEAVFQNKVVLKDLYQAVMSADFSADRYEKLI